MDETFYEEYYGIVDGIHYRYYIENDQLIREEIDPELYDIFTGVCNLNVLFDYCDWEYNEENGYFTCEQKGFFDGEEEFELFDAYLVLEEGRVVEFGYNDDKGNEHTYVVKYTENEIVLPDGK